MKLNEYWKTLLTWVCLWGSLPFILALFCQIIWTFNTHWKPVRWHLVPELTLMIVLLSGISFEAGTKFQKIANQADTPMSAQKEELE